MAEIVLPFTTERVLPAQGGFGRLARSVLAGGRHDQVARLEAMNVMLRAEVERQQRRIEELEQYSRTDGLTGILNRAGFDDALARTVNAAQRHDDGGALA